VVTSDLRWGHRAHVTVDGVGIHVESAGPSNGVAVVGLHGFASGTFTWAGVAAELRDDLRVVAWDRPPFGRSERPSPRTGPDDPYGLEAEIRRSVRLVEQLAPGRRVLVGHSAGALLAIQLVLARAVRVDGLVLIAPAIDAEPPLAVRAIAGLPGSGLVAASLLRVGVRGAAGFLRRSTRHRSALTDATAAETGRTLRRPGTAEALWHLTATWQSPRVADRLSEVGVPAVVIGGINDRIVSLEQHRAAVAGLGAELHLVEGAGHAPHEQRPELVAAHIRDFVAAF
jgi:pimeloyl-ACP methyl ester carboxylesterase